MALGAMTITSCSDKEEAAKYTYTYDGVKKTIVWAGYYHRNNETQDGYCFGISPTVPNEYLFEEVNFFEVDYPAEQINEKCDLSEYCGGAGWDFYGYFRSNGTFYYFEDNDSGGDISGSNNWVKVTKNAGEHNFTLEFDMTIGGKRLVGNYTGIFKKYEDYAAVGGA